jgi:hypothetical protein
MAKEYTRNVKVLGPIPALGELLLHDDFSDINRWTKTDGGGDDVFRRDIGQSLNSLPSLRLKSRTTSADTGDEIGASLGLHLLPSQEVSIIWTFLGITWARFDTAIFGATWQSGPEDYAVGIRYTHATPAWAYLNSGGTYTNISGMDELLEDSVWHRLSMSFNFNTSEYIQTAVNHESHTLADIAIGSTTQELDVRFQPTLSLKTVGANPVEMYVDSVLIHSL